MPKLVVVNREGQQRILEGDSGLSVMQIIRDNDLELLALCGGCMSCGTCHVYVDPAFANKLSQQSEGECDLLDSSQGRTEQSRLSCQIKFSDELDGLRVTIAPED